MVKNNFIFFSLAPTGVGISGSDRIFIELAREWSNNIPVNIFTTCEGAEMVAKQDLTGKYLKIEKVENGNLPSNFFLKYLYKIFLSIKLGMTYQIPNSKFLIHNSYLYSSSDFWMDVFPAVLLKIRYPKLKWIAAWFQTAPNPIEGFSVSKRREKYRYSAFLYWLSQLPIKPLINKYADFVIVNNEDERKRFPEMEKKGKVIVLIGAVRMDRVKEWKSKSIKVKNIYDCVFQGRFHPQKGVVELIDIWRKVVDEIPDAKLAMIGDGPLFKNVEFRIKNLGLEKNVKLFGYVFDGPEKYKIFTQSKIVVHPAFYDSGGMASAEAMAFGLPCVGFDLVAYKSYYPKGMVKVERGNLNEFSEEIVKLINNKKKREKIGKDAYDMISKNWSWEARVQEILTKLI